MKLETKDGLKAISIVLISATLFIFSIEACCIIDRYVETNNKIKIMQAKAQIERCKLITDKTY